MSADWTHLQTVAESEIDSILRSLPAELTAEARRLPVTFEARPGKALRADGIEPDTLGLFVGEPFADFESGTSPLPPHVILFLQNLWDAADEEEKVYREEVRTTFLHEFGHYLGLDESDLEERGLD